MGSIFSPPSPAEKEPRRTGNDRLSRNRSLPGRLKGQYEAERERARRLREFVNEKQRVIMEKRKLFNENLAGFGIENAIAIQDLRKFRFPRGVTLPSDLMRAKSELEISAREYDALLKERDRAEEKERALYEKLYLDKK